MRLLFDYASHYRNHGFIFKSKPKALFREFFGVLGRLTNITVSGYSAALQQPVAKETSIYLNSLFVKTRLERQSAILQRFVYTANALDVARRFGNWYNFHALNGSLQGVFQSYFISLCFNVCIDSEDGKIFS